MPQSPPGCRRCGRARCRSPPAGAAAPRRARLRGFPDQAVLALAREEIPPGRGVEELSEVERQDEVRELAADLVGEIALLVQHLDRQLEADEAAHARIA